MLKIWSFLAQFWQETKTVGSFIPSTPILARRILSHVDFEKAKIIVEVGPGTGVFTRRILKRLGPTTKFYIFELNKSFCINLQKEINDNRCVIINDSAEHIQKYIEKDGYTSVDYIISSLPLSNFSPKLIVGLLQKFRSCIGERGKLIQFQYSFNQKNLIHKMFNKVEMDFTQFNIPPGFIYICSNK